MNRLQAYCDALAFASTLETAFCETLTQAETAPENEKPQLLARAKKLHNQINGAREQLAFMRESML